MRPPFLVAAVAACVCLGRPLPAVAEAEVPRVIFDTDITGDCDDVLALAMCHTLADRNACELLAARRHSFVIVGAPRWSLPLNDSMKYSRIDAEPAEVIG